MGDAPSPSRAPICCAPGTPRMLIGPGSERRSASQRIEMIGGHRVRPGAELHRSAAIHAGRRRDRTARPNRRASGVRRGSCRHHRRSGAKSARCRDEEFRISLAGAQELRCCSLTEAGTCRMARRRPRTSSNLKSDCSKTASISRKATRPKRTANSSSKLPFNSSAIDWMPGPPSGSYLRLGGAEAPGSSLPAAGVTGDHSLSSGGRSVRR
jgi:hypothetical protein